VLKGDGNARSAMQLPPSVVVAANSITNALLALNSAVNFAIYCLVGNKFRRILRRRVLPCGSTSAEDTATTAVLKSVAAVPVAPAIVGSSRGESPAAGKASETARRLTDADGASDCCKDVAPSHNENHVVVVDVSAANAAETACSSPTTPSAVEELTAILGRL